MSFRIEGIAFGSGKPLIPCYEPKGYLETGEYREIEGILSRLSFTNDCQICKASIMHGGFRAVLDSSGGSLQLTRREHEVLLRVFTFYGVMCTMH